MPANSIAVYPQTGGLVLISKQVLAATTASISFNVPQNFTNLRIVTNSKSTAAGNGYLQANFNGDVSSDYGNNYAVNFFSNSWTVAGDGTGDTSARVGAAGNNDGDGAVSDITIMNYTSAFEKMVTGNATGDSVGVMVFGAAWRNTAAITSITLTPDSGSFLAGSTFSLYGLL